MEPLALLCNLYGEGPGTLRRLSGVGIDTLEHLVETDLGELIEKTGWERAEATELLLQARALAERLGTALLEPEGEARSPEVSAALPDEPLDGRPGEADRLEADRRETVLATWRELDDKDDGANVGDVLVPLPPPPSEDSFEHGLELFAADLSDQERQRLLGLGVGTVSEFVAASTLDLARELELGFTRVRRLQLLASRLGSPGPHPTRPNPDRSRPAEPEPGAGGPFA